MDLFCFLNNSFLRQWETRTLGLPSKVHHGSSAHRRLHLHHQISIPESLLMLVSRPTVRRGCASARVRRGGFVLTWKRQRRAEAARTDKEGKCVRAYFSSHWSFFFLLTFFVCLFVFFVFIKPTAETKFYGQTTTSRSLRARDAAALVPPGGPGDTRCRHALPRAWSAPMGAGEKAACSCHYSCTKQA